MVLKFDVLSCCVYWRVRQAEVWATKEEGEAASEKAEAEAEAARAEKHKKRYVMAGGAVLANGGEVGR